MPMHGAACSHTNWHTFPKFCWFHMAQTSKGKSCQCMGLHAIPSIGILFPYCSGPCGPEKYGKSMPMCDAACSPMHWHTFPLLFWSKWPRKVGDKYANAWGCMQPHALAYLSSTVLVHMAKQSRGNYANAWGCTQPRALAYFSLYFPRTRGPDK